MLKNQSKTEIVVKEMSKKEPEQAEIYICNNYTNPDDTVAHLCWDFQDLKTKILDKRQQIPTYLVSE